jgi:uncharacterized protein
MSKREVNDGLNCLKPLDPAWLESKRLRLTSPLQGEFLAADLPRLSDNVVALHPPVVWQLAPDPNFPTIGHPRPRWWLTVKADLSVTCERCLEPMPVQVSAVRGFEFMASAAQADLETEQWLLSEDPDPSLAAVDFLAPEDGLSLRDLVEDEIFLSLPPSPKHPDCQPPAAASREPEPETVRPFADLQALLKKPSK